MNKKLPILITSLLLVGSLRTYAASSPVGTWDCVLSGHRSGTAYFDFSGTPENGTFQVFEIIVPNTVNTNPAGGRTGTGRGGEGSTPPVVPAPQIFGFEFTNGVWTFDANGRVIGSFVETSTLLDCKTEAIPVSTNTFATAITPIAATVTNGVNSDPFFCVDLVTATNDLGGGQTNFSIQETCFTNVSVCNALTNAVSFVGTVVPGKRIVLSCSTPFGHTMYKGVPAAPLPPISGSYSGIKRQNGISYIEIFSMAPSFSFPNTYDVALTGPGYTYHGSAILSSQKRISFSLGRDPSIPTNQITIFRAVSGPFNATKATAKTKGFDQAQGELVNPIHFDIQPIP